MTPAGVDPLKRANNHELFLYYLKLADDLRKNQIHPGPVVNQHLCDFEVADCWWDQQWQAPYRGGAVRVVLFIKDDERARPLERLRESATGSTTLTSCMQC